LKKLFWLPLFLAFKTVAQQKYWQQQCNYKIDVSLNDVDHTLKGYEQITYFNNSPDTLNFIWIHVWPNAYKNDKTAFSEQLLINSNTSFYFADENDRGYINQLSFTSNKINLAVEDHPQHQDIIKVLLEKPLAPNTNCIIESFFKVKLPKNISRSGHVNQSYQVTQWYPKAAVYDKNGWHEMPYLDQGEFYNNFGNYEVQITVPENYVVGATGSLETTAEKQWLNNLVQPTAKQKAQIASSANTKTILFKQDNVTDFAWFADKNFVYKQDTVLLPNNKIVQIELFVQPKNMEVWKNALQYTKRAVLSKSNWIGAYPYGQVKVVDFAGATEAGMEYPTITLLYAEDKKDLEDLINHEVGHNWFQAILATNERATPWMDEGMNTYYDNRYHKVFMDSLKRSSFFETRIPKNEADIALKTVTKLKIDQPIQTVSENFNYTNYGLIAYTKAAKWMELLEKEMGTALFDSAMQNYFENWKFKHPTTNDFKQIMESVSGKDLSNIFLLLNQKGDIVKEKKAKGIKFNTLFNLKENGFNNISIAPVFGINNYDKFMIGAALHNYALPPKTFNFFVAPMYATGTKMLNGIAKLGYTFYLPKPAERLTIDLNIAKFTGGTFKDSTGFKNPLQFTKIVPSIKYVFAQNNPLSMVRKYLQFKSFIITETQINFRRDVVNDKDIITYPKETRYVNQLQFGYENNRKLYPHNFTAQAEQGENFMRLNFTGNYFFNYQKGGGMQVRLFAGKFLYLGEKSLTNQFKTAQYHLQMSGPRGNEDYTYQNYFFGRSAFEGFASQQMMKRDGFFKVATDLLSSKVGVSDNWLTSVNIVTDIPDKVNILNALPIKIPIKLFADVGTYAEAWKPNSRTGKFLFDAGIQLSLFKQVLNVYIPIVYSKVYSDYYKSTIPEKRFQKTIAFSIDLGSIKPSIFVPNFNF
jgi:hypothetical protein